MSVNIVLPTFVRKAIVVAPAILIVFYVAVAKSTVGGVPVPRRVR